MSDPEAFHRSMAAARHHLLANPNASGERVARATIRRFLVNAETPAGVVDRLEDALLDAAYRGRWEGFRAAPGAPPTTGIVRARAGPGPGKDA